MQLQIINAHTLLGFSKSINIIEIHCTSSKPINVMAITNVFLHLEPGYDLNINDGNLDNHKEEIAQSNSIILFLPVDQMYNNTISYNNEDGRNSWIFKCTTPSTLLAFLPTLTPFFLPPLP